MGRSKTIISLGGRLGNMLFSMAAGTYYAKQHNKDCYIYFLPQNELWRSQYNSYTRFHIYPEYKGPIDGLPVVSNRKDYVFEELPHYDGDVFFDGSFESEKFFPESDLINKLYSCPTFVEDSIREKIPYIDECVGISIRRGDYLNFRSIFLMPEVNWYTDMYHKYFEGREAVIFSDDINWCKCNLERNENFIFYDNVHRGFDIYNIVDPITNIYTMALCGNHICSHSTWSWWGARLCEKDSAINIFPDKRFTKRHGLSWADYIPERWLLEKAKYTNDDWI